jgi:hypothetical protein
VNFFKGFNDYISVAAGGKRSKVLGAATTNPHAGASANKSQQIND